jgi:hypothetical protein
MNGKLFVFRPGGMPGDNVFTDWLSLMNAMSVVDGRKILEFDDSVTSPCKIPPGQWTMKDVMWAGFGPRPGVPRTTVAILRGAEFTDLRMIGRQITIVNLAESSPFPSVRFQQQTGPCTNRVARRLREHAAGEQIRCAAV